MSDEIDKAQDNQANYNDDALRRHQRLTKIEPTEFCIDCDEPINEVRRKIGACRCFDCQSIFERKR